MADAQVAQAEKRAKDAEYLVKHLEREVGALKESVQYNWRDSGPAESLRRHHQHGGALVCAVTHALHCVSTRLSLPVQKEAVDLKSVYS